MSYSSPKICLIAPLPPPYGGIGNWTLLVQKYSKLNGNVSLHVLDTAPRWRAIYDLSVLKRIIGGGGQLLRDYIRFLNLFWQRPDIVHLTTSGQLSVIRDIVILATAKLIKIPSFYHIRFGRIPDIAKKNTFEWKIMAKAICLAHTVISIDSPTAFTIEDRFPRVRTLQIPNGIDLNILPPSRKKLALRTLLFLGWVIPSKGIDELVQAWAQLRIDGWRCVIAGPGSDKYREELSRKFKPSHLEFLPEQSHDEAMKLIATSDIFILPSHTEGFPNVIIEAMAMGKPIIATSVGAIPEMLNGGCGVIVPPRNVAALVKVIKEMCSNASLRNNMGIRAQIKSKAEYSMDIVFKKLMLAWRESLER